MCLRRDRSLGDVLGPSPTNGDEKNFRNKIIITDREQKRGAAIQYYYYKVVCGVRRVDARTRLQQVATRNPFMRIIVILMTLAE